MIRRSESIIKFWQNIGFVSRKKNGKLLQAAEYAKGHIHRIHKNRTEKIVQINKLPSQDVFDIEVPKYHRFVANGIVVHNTAKSALMKVVSGLIPRGRYVSGKGVTGAGLTATVVRDEEFLGGWVLEAGAMVMCNKSLICIDEFEKIEKTDLVALHEAMEQNTISIAKANIIATLPAQTAVLGGGNPKLGRFDPYLPIKEQIDVPDTLLARFDLKFALRDIPNVEQDTKIADHILKSRHYDEEEVKPEIDSDLLKKYIAYARKNCHPKLPREAGEPIKNFFVGLRERTTTEEAPVPITLRQYEALIRLAESSAKIQLRNTVTLEDAIRAINLMKASLRQFGFEAETGKFDIDRLEGRITAVERGKIRITLDVIEELSKTMGKTIPKEDIINLAKSKGLKEFDIEKILDELKNKGDLFEPKPGIVQKM
jgi:replicative DNA helicase Mcm